MTVRIAAPFTVPPETAVAAHPWLLTTDDGHENRLGDVVTDWDVATPLRLRRRVAVDGAAVIDETGLEPGSGLALVATWESSSTRIRRAGGIAAFPLEHGITRILLDFVIVPEEAGGRLTLTTSLVTGKVVTSDAPLAPDRAGAILWRDAVKVVLEGDATRLSTEVIDFASAHLPTTAPWHVIVDVSNTDEPALNLARVQLNRDHPYTALLTTDIGDSLAAAVAGMLQYEVARAIIEAVLSNEGTPVSEAAAEGSASRSIALLVNAIWPGRSLRSLRAEFSADPASIHTRIRSRIGFEVMD